MTRDEFLADVTKEVTAVLPKNEELSGDDLETIENVLDECVSDAGDVLDGEEEEEEEQEETKA